MLAGCDWWKFWKGFRGWFVYESCVSTKTVVNVFRPHYTRGIWKRIWERRKCFPSVLCQRNLKRNRPRSCGICLIFLTPSFPKSSFSKLLSSTRKRKSGVVKFLRFEQPRSQGLSSNCPLRAVRWETLGTRLRFEERLEKLRLQIPPAKCRRCLILAAVKTELPYWNDMIIAFFFAANKNKEISKVALASGNS